MPLACARRGPAFGCGANIPGGDRRRMRGGRDAVVAGGVRGAHRRRNCVARTSRVLLEGQRDVQHEHDGGGVLRQGERAEQRLPCARIGARAPHRRTHALLQPLHVH
eukprot:scaffold4114_cov363-Prasinococcus_capsulatus_cf.AAC.2